jgi:hypothetical protein
MPLAGMGPTVLGLFAAGFGVGALLVLVPHPSADRVAKYDANGSAPREETFRISEELAPSATSLEGESANMGKPDATDNAPKSKLKAKGKRKARKSAKGASADAASDGDDLDLRKLDRVQLLQLLRDAMEENERLHAQLDEATERAEQAERQLEDRRIQVEDSESLAEASLRLAGVFVDAQRAIDLYGYNVAMNEVSGGGSLSAGPRHFSQDDRDRQPNHNNTGEPEGQPGGVAQGLSAEAAWPTAQSHQEAMQANARSASSDECAKPIQIQGSDESSDDSSNQDERGDLR